MVSGVEHNTINLVRYLFQSHFLSGGNGTMVQQLAKLKEYIMDVLNRCGQITSNIITAKGTAESSMDDIMKAEEAIKRYFWSFYSHSLFSSLFLILSGNWIG